MRRRGGAQQAVRGLLPTPTTADMVEALRACAQRYMAAGRNAHDAYLQALRDVGSATMFTGFTLSIGVLTWPRSKSTLCQKRA